MSGLFFRGFLGILGTSRGFVGVVFRIIGRGLRKGSGSATFGRRAKRNCKHGVRRSESLNVLCFYY